MKKIPLTRGMFALVDDEDYEFLSQWKWFCDSNNYAARGCKERILMHRLINKTPEGLDTDHINGNRLDNRRSNLRSAHRWQNAVNRPRQSNNTSGFKGVSLHKRNGKWQAWVIQNKIQYHLGYFQTKYDAAAAVDREALKRTGEFARLNLACSALCASA